MNKNAQILILYGGNLSPDASTIDEYIDAFSSYGKFSYTKVNTISGFEDELQRCHFDAMILHYSLFGSKYYLLTAKYLQYIKEFQQPKVAIFQDEGYYCYQRFDFINQHGIDAIITLMSEKDNELFYKKYTNVTKFLYAIPGYVDYTLVKNAKKLTLPYVKREICVFYRGRTVPYFMGDSAIEKRDIGKKFQAYIDKTSIKLNLDISSKNEDRLYGTHWHKALGNSKAVLGIESGYSIVDIDDKLLNAYTELIKINPNLTYAQYKSITKNDYKKYSKDFYYRTISPRHFEATIFGCVQVLYEGKYSNILKPNIHYIELKKDFSNIDDVIKKLQDKQTVDFITKNAYKDLIESDKYSYSKFINSIEDMLLDLGVTQTNPTKITIHHIHSEQELREKNQQKNNQLKDKPIEILAQKYKNKKLVAVSDAEPLERYIAKLQHLKDSSYILAATISAYVKLAPLGIEIDLILIKNHNFAPIYYMSNLDNLLKINPPTNIIYIEDANFEAVIGFSKSKKTKRYICKSSQMIQSLPNPPLLTYILKTFSPKEIILIGYA